MCHSSKDAETLNILKMVDDSVYAAKQLEMLLYGDDQKRIKVKLFTDSEATLESVVSSKQIERKTLRMTVVDLKERLLEGDVYSYAWLPTEKMWADILLLFLRKAVEIGQGVWSYLPGTSLLDEDTKAS